MQAAQVGGAAKAALMDQTEIGCKLARDLVAQAQAGFHCGQARTDAALWIVAAVQFHFQQRLQDQPAGEQQFVLDFGIEGGVAAAADIRGGRDLELVRGQSLYANRRPGP